MINKYFKNGGKYSRLINTWEVVELANKSRDKESFIDWIDEIDEVPAIPVLWLNDRKLGIEKMLNRKNTSLNKTQIEYYQTKATVIRDLIYEWHEENERWNDD